MILNPRSTIISITIYVLILKNAMFFAGITSKIYDLQKKYLVLIILNTTLLRAHESRKRRITLE